MQLCRNSWKSHRCPQMLGIPKWYILLFMVYGCNIDHIFSLCAQYYFFPQFLFSMYVCTNSVMHISASWAWMFLLLSLSFLYIDIPKFFNSSLCKLFYWTHLYERNSLSSTCHIANHFWMSFLYCASNFPFGLGEATSRHSLNVYVDLGTFNVYVKFFEGQKNPLDFFQILEILQNGGWSS